MGIPFGDAFLLLTAVPQQVANDLHVYTSRGLAAFKSPHDSLFLDLTQFNGFITVGDLLNQGAISHDTVALLGQLVEAGILTHTHKAVLAASPLTESPSVYPIPQDSCAEHRAPTFFRSVELGGANRNLTITWILEVLNSSLESPPMEAFSAGDIRLVSTNSAGECRIWDLNGTLNEPSSLEGSYLRYALNQPGDLPLPDFLVVVAPDLDAELQAVGNEGFRKVLIRSGALLQRLSSLFKAEKISFSIYENYQDAELRAALFPAQGGARESRLISSAMGLYSQACKAGRPSRVQQFLNRIADGGSTRVATKRISKYKTVISQANYIDRHGDLRRATGASESQIEADLKAIMEGFERGALNQRVVDLIAPKERVAGRLFIPRGSLHLLRDDEPIAWTKGHSSQGEVVNIPTDAVFLSGLRKENTVGPYPLTVSTGTAAHQERTLAIQSAWLELVERAAFREAWAGTTRLGRVESLPGWFLDMAKAHEQDGWICNAFSVSAIAPTAMVTIRGPKEPALSLGLSSAKSFDQALSKAWREAMLYNVHYRSYRSSRPSGLQDLKSPIDHALYYLEDGPARRIDPFFQSAKPCDAPAAIDLEHLTPYYAVDLPSPRKEVYVVRVFSDLLNPISFGAASLDDFRGVRKPWGPGINPHPLG